MNTSASHPFCLATVVTAKAIEAMLEVSGEGSYRDDHPWLVARELWQAATAQDRAMPILFACKPEVGNATFTHWSWIQNIEVVELHRGQWDTRCTFSQLHAMNPIWEEIDSVFVKASDEQMRREECEGVRVFRTALDEHHIHPYAICETPAFILDQASA